MNLEKIALKIRKILKKIHILESISYFLYKFFFSPNSSKRTLKFEFCSFCGKNTIMLVGYMSGKNPITFIDFLSGKNVIKLIDSSILRDNGSCLLCTANTRYRFVAEIIKKIIVIKLFNEDLDKMKLRYLLDKINLRGYSLKKILEIIRLKDFRIYEPSSFGPIYNTLKKHPKFIFSDYFPYPYLKSGQYVGNTRHEDLRSLSFGDNSIDLIITQDVFEHIKKPFLAFKEIYRVLKPNGLHIFTVPIYNIKKTFCYFDDHGNPLTNKIIFHKDPLRREGAKVYTQFGLDIIDILNNFNFSSFILTSEINPKIGIFGEIKVIISMKIV